MCNLFISATPKYCKQMRNEIYSTESEVELHVNQFAKWQVGNLAESMTSAVTHIADVTVQCHVATSL